MDDQCPHPVVDENSQKHLLETVCEQVDIDSCYPCSSTKISASSVARGAVCIPSAHPDVLVLVAEASLPESGHHGCESPRSDEVVELCFLVSTMGSVSEAARQSK
jgi:hypothetical protein